MCSFLRVNPGGLRLWLVVPLLRSCQSSVWILLVRYAYMCTCPCAVTQRLDQWRVLLPHVRNGVWAVHLEACREPTLPVKVGVMDNMVGTYWGHIRCFMVVHGRVHGGMPRVHMQQCTCWHSAWSATVLTLLDPSPPGNRRMCAKVFLLRVSISTEVSFQHVHASSNQPPDQCVAAATLPNRGVSGGR